jgi:hypothetical protein
MKFEVASSHSLEGDTVYELKIYCGLDILCLQFFTLEELGALQSTLGETIADVQHA